MNTNDAVSGIGSMAALGVEAGMGMGIIGMVSNYASETDPMKRKKKRQRGR